MPIGRKLEEAVPILLRVLSDDKLKDSNTQYLNELTKIRRYFEVRPDLFRNLKETEDELLKNFTALEEAIDDSKYSIDGSGDTSAVTALEEAIERFESIQGIVPKFKGLTPKKIEEVVPILLPLLDEMMKGFNNQDPAFGRWERIKGDLEEKKKLFLNSKIGEDKLLQIFTRLEEEIKKSKNTSTDSLHGTPRHPPEKIDSNKEILDSITDLISTFQRLPIEASQKEAEPEAQAREISEEWSTLKVERHILESPVLSRFQLSYDHITDLEIDGIDCKKHTIPGRTIKLCLLFFSVFPAKSVIKKRPLIYWWLGEGLITKMEDGEGIFWELIKKGFLIAEYKPYEKGQDKNPIVDRCRMHSWIRRMLISVAKEAQFFDFDVDTGLPANHGNDSRRMCLVKQRYLDEETPTNREASQQEQTQSTAAAADDDDKTESPCMCLPQQSSRRSSKDASTEPRLLTLFNVNEQYLNMDNIKRFSEENKMVVLQLGRWQDSAKHHIEVENEDFLKALGTKQHLRYLSLRGISRITEITSSISKLTNLEILDLRACHNLEKLPSDISSLKKLTHLDISECHLLESMPKGLDKLTSLQVLKGFVVEASKKSPCKLGNLTGLTKLGKLSIYIRKDANMEEISKLKEFSSLRILSITWGGGVEGQMNSSPFPPLLKKLDLWCIPETKPAWLDPGKLQSLSKLYIRGGELAGFNASTTGRNLHWRVQILRLKYLDKFKEDDTQLRQSFPYLIYLERKNKDGASSSRS